MQFWISLGYQRWIFRNKTRVSKEVEHAVRVPLEKTADLTLSECRRRMHLLNIAANHHIVNANCLLRSMVGWKYLQRHGLNPSLRIGVQLQSGALLGHAWLEINQQVVNDEPAVTDKFSVMESTTILPKFH